MWPGRPRRRGRRRLGGDRVAVGQQHERVEVALHGAVVADRSPGVVEADAPVDADRPSPPASASMRQQLGLPVAKLITGTPGVMPSMIACTCGSTYWR